MPTASGLRRMIGRLPDVEVYTLVECGPTPQHRSIASQVAHARAVAEAKRKETTMSCEDDVKYELCDECGADIPWGYLFHYAHDLSCSLYDAKSNNGLATGQLPYTVTA